MMRVASHAGKKKKKNTVGYETTDNKGDEAMDPEGNEVMDTAESEVMDTVGYETTDTEDTPKPKARRGRALHRTG